MPQTLNNIEKDSLKLLSQYCSFTKKLIKTPETNNNDDEMLEFANGDINKNELDVYQCF